MQARGPCSFKEWDRDVKASCPFGINHLPWVSPLRRPGNMQSSTMSPAGVPLPFCGMHAVLLGAGNAEKRVEWFCPEAVVDQPWKQLNRSD